MLLWGEGTPSIIWGTAPAPHPCRPISLFHSPRSHPTPAPMPLLPCPMFSPLSPALTVSTSLSSLDCPLSCGSSLARVSVFHLTPGSVSASGKPGLLSPGGRWPGDGPPQHTCPSGAAGKEDVGQRRGCGAGQGVQMIQKGWKVDGYFQHQRESAIQEFHSSGRQKVRRREKMF